MRHVWARWGGESLDSCPTPDIIYYPNSPLAGVIDEALIDANLDFELDRQSPDGSWSPSWSWDFVDAAAWMEAEREWKGILTLRKLRTLRAFGRIERL